MNQNSVSGVLFTKISDHLPTFLFQKVNPPKKQYHPKYILKQSVDDKSINDFKTALENSQIMNKLDFTETACPNKNYGIMENVINTTYHKHLPTKKVKYNKYKHKDATWITQGIMNSIKFRDDLYKRQNVPLLMTHSTNQSA